MKILTLLIAVNFLSEIAHGILSRQLGTDRYAPLTIGEVVRGSILLILLVYAIVHGHRFWSICALVAVQVMGLLVIIQMLTLGLTMAEGLNTALRGLRWLYIFMIIAFVAWHTYSHKLSSDKVIFALKVSVVIAYSIPIILSAVGIAGYSAYGDDSTRKGYLGFVMNQNVVASCFIFLLPFYLVIKRRLDLVLLGIYCLSALLLGSKLVYLGFAAVFVVHAVLHRRAFLQPWGAAARAVVKRVPATGLPLLVLALVVVVPLTPPARWSTQIWQGMIDQAVYYMDPNYGYAQQTGRVSSFVDVLTSQRTWRIEKYLDWAADGDNDGRLVIGGGVPLYLELNAEVDWVDLLTLFGIVGLVLFYGGLLLLLRHVALARDRPYGGQTVALIALALIASLTSGHTFDGPVVGIVIGMVLGVFLGYDYRTRAVPTAEPARGSERAALIGPAGHS